MYKSDKMARVNEIVTTMRFGKERIHCQNPGQRWVNELSSQLRACRAASHSPAPKICGFSGVGGGGADRAAAPEPTRPTAPATMWGGSDDAKRNMVRAVKTALA
jgi:hypothetical protein